MTTNAGSVEVEGTYKDGGLLLSLAKLKNQFKAIGHQAKSVGTDMVRLTAKSRKLQGILGLLGAFSFFSLLASAPRTAAFLDKIKTYAELMWMIFDKHLSPAVEWLAEKFKDLYMWLKKLDPEMQKWVVYGVTIAFVLGLASAATLGMTIAAMGLKGALIAAKGKILAVIGAILGPVGLAIAIGLVTVALAEWAADKYGVYDWLGKLNKKYLDAADSGKLWAVAIRLALAPLGLVMAALEDLVEGKGWIRLHERFETFKKDINSVTEAYEKLLKKFGLEPQSNQIGIRAGGSPRPGYADNEGGIIYAGRDKRHVGGMVGKDGAYWLQAGETVYAKGDHNEDNSKETTIINQITGNTFMMGNGMGVDEFADMLSRKQARDAKYRSY
jgi:hypothetical protein